MRFVATVPALAGLLVLSTGCTGDDDGARGDSGARLNFEFADGTSYVTDDPPTVTCDKSACDGLDRMNVAIPVGEAGTSPRYAWLIFPTSAVDQERTWELPYSGHDEASEMIMFVTGEGSTSGSKGANGTVTISRAICGEHPELEASFDATLGSQTTGHGGVTITGDIDQVQRGSGEGSIQLN